MYNGKGQLIEKRVEKPKLGRFTGQGVSAARALAVRAQLEAGVSQREVARKEKMSRSVVRAIAYDDRFDRVMVDQVKKGLPGAWWFTADRALSALTDEKLASASASQLGILAAIATEKGRLMEGLSTENVSVVDLVGAIQLELDVIRKKREKFVAELESNAGSDDTGGGRGETPGV